MSGLAGKRPVTSTGNSSAKRLHSSFKSPMRRPDETVTETPSTVQLDINNLTARELQLNEQIKQLRDLGLHESELQLHVDKLHKYNEMKDLGQMLLGRIAVLEGVPTRDLYEQFGLKLED